MSSIIDLTATNNRIEHKIRDSSTDTQGSFVGCTTEKAMRTMNRILHVA
jgi:hypothetical protein